MKIVLDLLLLRQIVTGIGAATMSLTSTYMEFIYQFFICDVENRLTTDTEATYQHDTAGNRVQTTILSKLGHFVIPSSRDMAGTANNSTTDILTANVSWTAVSNGRSPTPTP